MEDVESAVGSASGGGPDGLEDVPETHFGGPEGLVPAVVQMVVDGEHQGAVLPAGNAELEGLLPIWRVFVQLVLRRLLLLGLPLPVESQVHQTERVHLCFRLQILARFHANLQNSCHAPKRKKNTFPTKIKVVFESNCIFLHRINCQTRWTIVFPKRKIVFF